MKVIGVVELMKGLWFKDSCLDNVVLLFFIKFGINVCFVVRIEFG